MNPLFICQQLCNSAYDYSLAWYKQADEGSRWYDEAEQVLVDDHALFVILLEGA